MSSLPSVAIVGTGAVACALAVAHRAAGGAIVAVVSRDPTRGGEAAARWGARTWGCDPSVVVGADVVLVCVPDRAVAESGARLVAAVRAAGDLAVLLHTSGALAGAALLERAGGAAAAVGSLHPLQSFPAGLAGPAGESALAARVAGSHFFHEGAGADVARRLVAGWRGEFHALAPGGKALYHAGAAVVSNHTVALFADATRMLAAAGVPAAGSRAALASLLEGTAANLRAVGVPDALTGPVARGDVATVRRHVEALAASAPDLVPAYRAVALRAVEVALAKGGIDAVTADALRAAVA